MKKAIIHAVLGAIAIAGASVASAANNKEGASPNIELAPESPAPTDPTGLDRKVPVRPEPFLLAKEGVVWKKGNAWLGVATEDVPPVLAAHLERKNSRGAIVTAVVPDSPAAQAGIRKHDLILEVDDFELMSPRELTEFMAGKKPGDEVTLKLLREGNETVIKAKLSDNPTPPENPVVKAVPQHPRQGPAIDPMDLFRRGGHDPQAMMDQMQRQMDRMQEEMRMRFEKNFNFDLGKNNMNQIMRSNGTATFSDNDGSITVEMADGKKTVKATDKEGNVLFEGPANTDEEIAKMPEAVRERFERFDADPFEMNLEDFGEFGDFFRFDFENPKVRGPKVQKDFRRMKRPDQGEPKAEKTGRRTQ